MKEQDMKLVSISKRTRTLLAAAFAMSAAPAPAQEPAKEASPFIPIKGEPAPKLHVDPPLAGPLAPVQALQPVRQEQKMDTEFIKISDDITLRHMVLGNSNAKGTVLLLHGFPETLYAWKEVAQGLADDYEVHAFDWPGFGQSSRPSVDQFSYAPSDYAKVLRAYIDKAGIDRSKLTIYATDISGLPALLAALEEPDIARSIIVSDFAPFNRPEYMHERLQRLKSKPSADEARVQLNAGRDDTLENAFKRGLPAEAQFEISTEFADDMARGWGHGPLTSADAFYHYYSSFTRDQDYFEARLDQLKTPVRVVWGADDIYIKKEMGAELAERIHAELKLLPGIGHYAHLQSPAQTVGEIRATRP
jgi:pimeloyl-ACP methyl ester carboxylesterase